NGAESCGLEALYHASEFADVTCLRLLLEARPPLHPKRVSYCLARMVDFENRAGVELYLRHGADPNFRIPWMHDRTHLHRAVVYGRSLPIVRLLVEAGGDPNARDDLGFTPFRSAVRNGREDVARLLLGAGADEASLTGDDRTRDGLDPDVLCYAAGRNDVTEVRRLLGAGADPNALGGLDETPPLHWAVWRGSADAARLLVEGGADIHQINRYGGDALDTAIHGSLNCHDVFGGIGMKLPEEIDHGDYPAIVELLIAAGARLPPPGRGSEAGRGVLRRAGGAGGGWDREADRGLSRHQVSGRGGGLGAARLPCRAGTGERRASPQRASRPLRPSCEQQNLGSFPRARPAPPRPRLRRQRAGLRRGRRSFQGHPALVCT